MGVNFVAGHYIMRNVKTHYNLIVTDVIYDLIIFQNQKKFRSGCYLHSAHFTHIK